MQADVRSRAIEMHSLFRRQKGRTPETGELPGMLAFHGRITIEDSGEIRTALKNALSQKPSELTVDLSDVSYIDTAGVATFVEASRVARKQGIRLILAGLHDQPRSLLEITHLDRLFDIAGQEVGR